MTKVRGWLLTQASGSTPKCYLGLVNFPFLSTGISSKHFCNCHDITSNAKCWWGGKEEDRVAEEGGQRVHLGSRRHWVWPGRGLGEERFLVSPTGWWQCPACQWSYPATRGTQFSHWTWYRNTQPMDDRVADISGEATTDGLTWEPHRTFNMALRKTIFELKKPLSNIGKNKNGANSNKNCSKI